MAEEVELQRRVDELLQEPLELLLEDIASIMVTYYAYLLCICVSYSHFR